MKILVVNPGSQSKKYALYVNKRQVFLAHFENTPKGYILTTNLNGSVEEKKIKPRQFQSAFTQTIDYLKKQIIINQISDLRCIAVRVVCPGLYFSEHRIIDKTYLQKLNKSLSQAPLHIAATLEEVRFLIKKSKDAPIYAISDSAFHTTLPEEAKYYAINKKDSDALELYRYGYHGLSIQSIIRQIKDTGYLPEKIIVAHLGGGASITAVKNGKSIDTSMGFTPLEGLVMATRVGDIDAGALFYLGQKKSFTYKKFNRYLNEESGLLGVSQISSDIRVLLEKEAEGNKDVALALNLYAYKIKKTIGSYITVLNGLDLLVFTGTVGLRSDPMRNKIIHQLNHLHLELDKSKNKSVPENGYIHQENSVPILVAKTDEMGIIAQEATKLL